jgi:hypothetical protein
MNLASPVDRAEAFRRRYAYMGATLATRSGLPAQADACRLVIRKEKGLSEIVQFVAAGLEVGQQVVVMAGPTCLKEIARSLGEGGLRPDALLRSGKLVFLTAPNCLEEMFKSVDPFQRGPLHRHATVMRWVTDWSWAYANGGDRDVIRNYQRRIHAFVRPLNAISMCTVHCERVGRTSLLAMLVDHRHATRPAELASRAGQA